MFRAALIPTISKTLVLALALSGCGLVVNPSALRWLEEKRAALRRLPPVGRPT